ncbi:nitroreductase family protein [Rhizobium tumorigenes]|uniref:Nitroreductase family protein n=1 Tax=Rhizobium tumorigenes TaxID=2041385 RepID=A0AAF1K3Q2_9HYPH|nr:nitroreductase family protein [Rhizobium tumorigenes]WFR95212.1 nitroreductase family protein [Rhizobium tumorigenes]
MTSSNSRESNHPIDALFLDRWSPRAFNNETMPEADLLTILEAGHWAASSYNHQPWRFVYALRGSEQWDTFLSLLIDFNQSWVKSASALLFIVSRTHSGELGADDQKPIYSHSFDAGTASGYIALQAHLSGYEAHGMTGVHFDKVPGVLGIPDGFRVECAVAIGKIGDKNQLPEGLREREVPSPRKPLAEVAFNGKFVAK